MLEHIIKIAFCAQNLFTCHDKYVYNNKITVSEPSETNSIRMKSMFFFWDFHLAGCEIKLGGLISQVNEDETYKNDN